MSSLTLVGAIAFLAAALPIGIWVAWSDMKTMKIPNMAVLALIFCYLVIGPFVLTLPDFGWGLLYGLIVLVAGFVANALRLLGAGDAKFAAAMAPYFIGCDLRIVMALFAACLLGAFASHRLMRLIPPFRAATADWASWTHKDFPMGLALAGTLIFYLLSVIRLSA